MAALVRFLRVAGLRPSLSAGAESRTASNSMIPRPASTMSSACGSLAIRSAALASIFSACSRSLLIALDSCVNPRPSSL